MAIYKNSPPDTHNFIQATGITDRTQITAVSTLVADLKYAGIWNKMKAIYPIVGGTAAAHKFNLKDPRDLDIAYRLAFTAGWVHSSNGMTPNGSSDYANTFLIPNNILTNYNYHFSYYSRTLSISTGAQGRVDVGSQTSATQTSLLGIHSYGQTYFLAGNNTTTGIFKNPGVSDTRGLAVGSITSNSLIKLYFNNILLGTSTTANTNPLSTLSTWLGGNSNSGGIEFSNKQCAFASIGDGLTDTEAANFYTAVQKFQTTLGRQV